MKTQDKLKQQIEKLQSKLKLLEEKELEEKNKVDFIVVDGWAYETKDHDFNKKLSDIQISRGKKLWTYEDCIKLYNNYKDKLNLNDCWFYIKQPLNQQDTVAWFGANSGRAILDCVRLPAYSNSSLGVRFKWKVKKK
jgi:predicted nucleotide-binding protein (sugar kinase/HSP70/actin superfamily)